MLTFLVDQFTWNDYQGIISCTTLTTFIRHGLRHLQIRCTFVHLSLDSNRVQYTESQTVYAVMWVQERVQWRFTSATNTPKHQLSLSGKVMEATCTWLRWRFSNVCIALYRQIKWPVYTNNQAVYINSGSISVPSYIQFLTTRYYLI